MHRERGAVLVIALLLAGMLALLATSAMQSTVQELQLGAQQQALQRALASAEAGLARLGNQLLANPAATTLALTAAQCAAPDGSWCEADAGFVIDDAATSRASGGARTGSHYTARATGHAGRGAGVAIEAGWLLSRNADGSGPRLELRWWRRTDVD